MSVRWAARPPSRNDLVRMGEHPGTTVAIGAIGVALRCWQYLGNDSYFMDEAAVLRNLVERPWRTLLTEPLAYTQVAPSGFLLFQKLMLTVAGSTEYSLRFFPWACSAAALVAFARLVRALFPRAAAMTSLLMFATAGPLILFAAQVKQYSTDVLCTCVLLLAATGYLAGHRARDAYLLGLLSAVLVWFSHPAVIVLGGIAAVLLGEAALGRNGPARASSRPLLTALAIAGLAAAASALHAAYLLAPGAREHLHQYWEGGFLPPDLPASLSELWPYAQLRDLYGIRGMAAMSYALPGTFAVLTGSGLVLLVSRRGAAGALVAAPVVFALVAAAAGQYPFSDRMILFLVPCFVISVVASVAEIGWLLGRGWRPAGVAPLATLAGFVCFPVIARLPTYHLEHLRPVAQYVASHRAKGTPLYVYYGTVPAFSYYGPRFGLIDDATIIGTCHRGDTRQYLKAIDQMRGAKEAWILVGHSLGIYQERENILGYMDAIGTRRSRYAESGRSYAVSFGDVEAFEYDLSDAEKGTAASSASFEVTGLDLAAPGRTCGFGPQSMTMSLEKHPAGRQ